MAKWNYTLKNGSALREAINAEDLNGIVDNLLKCYQELFDAGLIDEDDFESWTEDLEVLYTDNDDEEYAEDNEDEIDWELGQFYDLCDNIGVWIPFT